MFRVAISLGLLHLQKNKVMSKPTIYSNAVDVDLLTLVHIKRRLCDEDNPLHREYDEKYDLNVSGEIDIDDLDCAIDYLLTGEIPPKYQEVNLI